MSLSLALWAHAGHIYQIESPPLPWLWPALNILAIALQLLAVFLNRRSLLVAGFAPLLIACLHERDITLLVGDVLAMLGLWFCLRPQKT